MIAVVAAKVSGYVSPSAGPDVHCEVGCGDTRYL